MPSELIAIDDMKRALIAVKQYCQSRNENNNSCTGCEFCGRYCLIDNIPAFWGTRRWEYELKATENIK